MTHAIEITLIDPVIASLGVATASTPTSLPYLPGAMLWGLLAAQDYQRQDASHDKVFKRLYGGDLIIGDALPFQNGEFALPMPKSLHIYKDGGHWEDWSKGERKPNFKQAKDGQVGPPSSMGGELALVEVKRTSTRRTAIDAQNLTAAKGQFFALEALAPGQKFVALIEGERAEWACKQLTGEHFLGRSRNAEFGRVRIDLVNVPRLPAAGLSPARFVWCLSDLAAYDEHYMPTQRPDTLFGKKIDWSKSFVRHRRYSPFNAYWQRRQPERLVISRGSVLVLKEEVDPGLRRVGFFQEQGLGLVLASAETPLALLSSWSGTCRHDSHKPEENREDTALSKWLRKRHEVVGGDKNAKASALDAWESDWKRCYEAARRLQGETCGPTPSQWATLVQMDNDALRSFLTDAKSATGEKERRSWQARFASGENGSFAGKALKLLDTEVPGTLQRTAHALRNALKRERWFDEQ